MYNGNEQEEEGGVSSTKDEASNVTFYDSEDERALKLKMSFRKNKMSF